MATGAIVAIVIVVIVVAAVLFMLTTVNRRRRLRERFGPEYDRAVTERGSRREAEAELTKRERHVRELDIRPLSPTARNQYQSEWTAVQEQFVDAPQAAVTGAQTLVSTVMEARGYPTQPYDQTVADLSVEHASTLDHFRAAHDISQNAAAGTATTEDLRQAMIHYRALFAELLGEPTSNVDARAEKNGVPATEPGAGTAGDQSAPGSINQSATTPVDEPATTRVDDPAATPVDDPAATRADDPAATPVDEPVATRADEPVAARADEPVAARADEPAAASVDQPADPALNSTHDAVTSARRQER
jgi:Cornifin (SPRR) family